MVLTFKESLIFVCYKLATRILHFSGLFSINFATTGQHFFKISLSILNSQILSLFDYKNSPQEIRSIVVCRRDKTDTQNTSMIQKYTFFDRRLHFVDTDQLVKSSARKLQFNRCLFITKQTHKTHPITFVHSA
jgi:hypothetical protein